MIADAPTDLPADFDRLRLIAIVESSDDAIVSKDLDGTIRTWNPAAERIFGYTAAEMVGGTVFQLIPPELHDEEHGLLERIRRGEHVAHYETERVRKDHRRIRISLTLSPLYDAKGRLIGASAIKRDVTSQRTLEHQLQQAQRMEAVGRLAGGIAHDFNNLLTVINGLTLLTIPHLAAESRERNNLEQVAKAAERAAALTQQLLTFSRRQLADVEVLELNEIVRSIESLLRRLIGEHIALDTRLAADLGHVRINRAQVEQIVMNLAVNARDAMPDGGSLTIQTENVNLGGLFVHERLRLEPGPYVVISVRDTGVGMDAVTQASIFEPFFTTKGPGHGTGLGLATVYAIVQQAGGAVYVYSEPKLGTVFKVYLPRIDAAVSAAPPTAAPSVEPKMVTKEHTILLVEDEPGVRMFSAQVLEDAGFSVLQAASGEEALELVATAQKPVSLVLTDVVMTGINGRVLADRLRALYPKLAVIYTSGYTDDIVVRAGVTGETIPFLHKPFTPQQLLERVRASLPAGRNGEH
jgi:PAS domain S-box-containing protein